MKMVFIARFKRVCDEEPMAKAFEACGFEVVRVEEDTTTVNDALAVIKSVKPDFVLFTKLQIPNAGFLIKNLRRLGIPSVSWTFDLLLGHPPRERVIDTFHFLRADLVLLTDAGHIKEYRGRGVNQHVLRQGIAEEFCYRGEPDEKYDFDIVFVGSKNPSFPYRQELLGFLSAQYREKFTWIGKDNTFAVRGHELNKLYASAKVIIGDSMYGPHYWSNRIYEVIGRGGFLIRPYIDGLDEHFEYYKDFVPYYYGDFKGLREKIDYYLEHPEDRERIAAHGFNTVKEKHLFKHRCEEFKKIYEDFISQRKNRARK